MANQIWGCIVRSDVVSALIPLNAGSVGTWAYGIETIADEDQTSVFYMPGSVGSPPTVAQALLGTRIDDNDQFQLQDIGQGEDPSGQFFVVSDDPVAASTAIDPGVICATDFSGGSRFVTFVQPAISATVSVTMLDTSWLVLSNEVYVQNAGIFTVTSITNSTDAVLTFTGVSAAMVKATA